MEIQLTEKTRN